MKDSTIKKTLVSIAYAGALTLFGALVNHIYRYETQHVQLEGRVVKEYGSAKNKTYGFELISNYGRDFYVNLNCDGKFGEEKCLAVEEAIKEGSLVRILQNQIREENSSSKDNEIHTGVCYGSSVKIIGEGGK